MAPGYGVLIPCKRLGPAKDINTGITEKNSEVDLTRFDGHLTSPRLRAEVFDDITEEGVELAA